VATQTIMRHLNAIRETPGGGFAIERTSQGAVGQYLLAHGFLPADCATYRGLLERLRYCNARDLELTLRQSAPRNDMRLLWRGLRRAIGLAG
jgi:hypothetical protein